MPRVERLKGMEILDSRGRPTVKAVCELASGARGVASVPSGASTGRAEALELRDGDPKRYGGLGCREAAGHVGGELDAALSGHAFDAQEDLDRAMLERDGTPDKSRLGANAILAVSLAFARAAAVERGEPLYEYLAGLAGGAPRAMPRPTVNLFSGGKHAGGQVPIQDALIVSVSSRSIDEALAMTSEVYRAAARLSHRKYDARELVADEGGLAPPFPDAEEMLADAVEAIRSADLEAGRDVALAVDVAASHFYREGFYHLGGEPLDGEAMVERLLEWIESYPIVSVEDGLAEEDWEHWAEFRARVRADAGGEALVLGDDLLCTNPTRIRRAAEEGAADALLLKVNQIGTLTEAAQALALARSAGWSVTVSARSGETEDDWLADLAVGWSAEQIKIGSITRSERLSKYNRLLEIEAETNLPLAGPPHTGR